MHVQDPVLMRQWHPVQLSKDLTDEPIAVEVLGEKIVVFRTVYGVHAFRDLCIHRGVPLSLGKIVNDEIVCPYHGWRYHHCGKCTRIPALPDNKAIPSKAAATTYACAEEYGFIWVCLGEPQQEKPVIGDQKLNNPEYVRVQMGPYYLEAAGPRVVENFLDVSHLMFVHEGLLGDSHFSEINDYQVRQINGFLISDEIEIYQPDPDGRGYGVLSNYVYKVYNPLSVAFTKKIADSNDFFHLFLMVQPVNEQKSIAFMIMERNYALAEHEKVFIDFQDKLIEQDRIIVESQKPELLPLDLQIELHLKSDRVSLAYRNMLRELGITFGTD